MIPDNMNPLYELSGCLDHGPGKCCECGCEIYHSNESDSHFYCIDCLTLEHIQALNRRKRKTLINDFGTLMAEMHKVPDWESMLIKKP